MHMKLSISLVIFFIALYEKVMSELPLLRLETNK